TQVAEGLDVALVAGAEQPAHETHDAFGEGADAVGEALPPTRFGFDVVRHDGSHQLTRPPAAQDRPGGMPGASAQAGAIQKASLRGSEGGVNTDQLSAAYGLGL